MVTLRRSNALVFSSVRYNDWPSSVRAMPNTRPTRSPCATNSMKLPSILDRRIVCSVVSLQYNNAWRWSTTRQVGWKGWCCTSTDVTIGAV